MSKPGLERLSLNIIHLTEATEKSNYLNVKFMGENKFRS